MQLENRVAIITGGGSGIGAATARRFAAEGASVILTGRRPDPIEIIAREIGGVAVPGDAADPEHLALAVSTAAERFGGLDVVVANAGAGFGGSAGEVTDENWVRTIDVNLTGPLLLVRAATPALVARGRGSIVLVSSIAAFVSGTDSAGYVATKAGLVGLARSLAVDYGPKGIRANAICPGWVRTPTADRLMDGFASELGGSREDAYAQAARHVPMRRAARPEEIAACCLFLASDESSFVTGAALVVDGGAIAVDVGTLAFEDN